MDGMRSRIPEEGEDAQEPKEYCPCLLEFVSEELLFDNTIREIYVHNIETLLKSAGLKRAFDKDVKNDGKLEVNRVVVTRWNERSRYEEHTETEARNLDDAVTDRKHGVLQWISQRW